MIRKFVWILLGAVIVAETTYLLYHYIQRRQPENFSCHANLVQHYNDDKYKLSLDYMIRGNFGLVHITGRSENNPENTFNRKVSFNLERNGDIFYMFSTKNIRLPDDNLSDDEMKMYVPHFFVTSERDIYMRVIKQKNNNFIFMVDSIPTYVCNETPG
ncbi:hypothetical protein [Pantoea sp. ARC270]|uniref:hypothetical protein n=1 Tax=Pantoea sp. ARC270 TaxID=2027923 RepID=UPI000DA83F00|nr:hypothetical protein [Pantoea sp. ARC270]